ncbi:unnamed protein product [Blepharisma stoltei]|uniref:Phosphatidic acid phosphatase type 2/haloperoxidase domain-containing protein n=1 Tax=Blepharisma stoltei TaxID=1481888 RepID=A0AAU9KDH8_9CILI|nr:unnamed protein product [Blepharisma stoltei]
MYLDKNDIYIQLSLVSSVSLTLIQVLLQNDLENSSASYIEWLQRGRSLEMDLTFQILGIATEIIFVMGSIIIYLSYDRKIGAVSTCAGIFGGAFSALLKLIFTQPRPYWKYSEIHALDCTKDWGTPSGHSLSAGCVILYIGMLWLQSKRHTSILKWLSIILASFITGLNRNFMGAHFYFQVVLGFSYAMLIVSILIHPKIEKILFKLNNRRIIIINATAIFLVFGALMLYLFRNPYWDDEWKKNYENKCDGNLDSKIASQIDLETASLFNAIPGFVWGFYKSKDLTVPKLTWKNIGTVVGMVAILSGILYGIESLLVYLITGPEIVAPLSFLMYGSGVCVGYLMPKIISKIIKADNPSMEKLTESDDLIEDISI